jgi:UDP-N-acetyl-D-mannosaminuronate dehydrogenase
VRGLEALEFAKLFETTYRAVMIAAFQEMHRMCSIYDVSINEAVGMIADIHAVDHNKPLHYPGVIGGTCLMPNIKLLLQAYNSDLLRWVELSNEMRKKEMRDPAVLREIEKIRERIEPSRASI